MQIAFVRHGITTWNLENRKQGTYNNSKLTEEGIIQGRVVGERLASLEDILFQRMYMSPLKRAMQTAEIIAGYVGLRPVVAPELHELSFGDWSGLTQAEIEERHPELLAERRRDKWNFRPPGQGESYADGIKRVSPFSDRVVALGEDALIVSHSMIGRTMMGYLLGYSPEKTLRIEHPFWVVYFVDPHSKRIVYMDSTTGESKDGTVTEFDYDAEPDLSPYRSPI